MIQSMTGYGKAEIQFENKNYVLELRSLNSKVLELNARLPSHTREIEIQLKKIVGENLKRGKVDLNLNIEDNILTVQYDETDQKSVALAGTSRALVNNMIIGVTDGFEKKLELIGVGYRAKASGKLLELTLGFSHPVKYQLPEDVEVETPSQTEVVLKSHNKQLLGQVAAEIRSFRPPEPYKGKGVRYSDEQVKRKEAKKAAGAGAG